MLVIKITAILFLLTVAYFVFGIEYYKRHPKEWKMIALTGIRPMWMKVGAVILTLDAIFIVLSAIYLLVFM